MRRLSILRWSLPRQACGRTTATCTPGRRGAVVPLDRYGCLNLFALYPGLTRIPADPGMCFGTNRADQTLFCGTITASRSDGSFTYTPARGFHGVDYFFYQLTAATEISLPVAVKISVGTPPVGVTDTYVCPATSATAAYCRGCAGGVLRQRSEHGDLATRDDLCRVAQSTRPSES